MLQICLSGDLWGGNFASTENPLLLRKQDWTTWKITRKISAAELRFGAQALARLQIDSKWMLPAFPSCMPFTQICLTVSSVLCHDRVLLHCCRGSPFGVPWRRVGRFCLKRQAILLEATATAYCSCHRGSELRFTVLLSLGPFSSLLRTENNEMDMLGSQPPLHF